VVSAAACAALLAAAVGGRAGSMIRSRMADSVIAALAATVFSAWLGSGALGSPGRGSRWG